MFYTTNLSPLLVTKKGFMLIIILSNYQQCPLHLSIINFVETFSLEKIVLIICFEVTPTIFLSNIEITNSKIHISISTIKKNVFN